MATSCWLACKSRLLQVHRGAVSSKKTLTFLCQHQQRLCSASTRERPALTVAGSMIDCIDLTGDSEGDSPQKKSPRPFRSHLEASTPLTGMHSLPCSLVLERGSCNQCHKRVINLLHAMYVTPL